MDRTVLRGRSARTALTGLSNVASKGLTGITSLVTIPLTLRYLGPERFGLWMTIASLQTLLSFADFGLGNSLLNIVSKGLGQGDRALIRRSIQSALKIQSLIAFSIAAAFLAAYPFVDWARLLNISGSRAAGETAPTLLIFVLAFCLRTVITVAQQAQLGLQRGYLANLWMAAGNVMALAGIVLAVHRQATLPQICLVFVGCPVVAGLINVGLWLPPTLRGYAPHSADKRVDVELRRQMLHVGLQFCILQVTASLIGGIDPLIASRLLGAQSVANLSVVQKPFEMMALFLVLLLQPLWPAYREAIVSQDVGWVRTTLRRVLGAALLFSTVGAVLMIVFGQRVIALWAGPDVHPTVWLIAGYGAANILAAYGTQVSFFFNAMGKLYFQLAIAVPAAIVALGLKYVFAKQFGLVAIPWVTAGVWLVMTAPAQFLYMRRLIRGVASLKL